VILRTLCGFALEPQSEDAQAEVPVPSSEKAGGANGQMRQHFLKDRIRKLQRDMRRV